MRREIRHDRAIDDPPRHGKAAVVKEGQRIRLINTDGFQIVDTWTFNVSDMKEFKSIEHCRSTLKSPRFKVGQSLVTSKRRPILALMADTTPGVHVPFQMRKGRWIALGPPGEASGPRGRR